ncbi:putative GED domain-containing protein [Seiridium cardinale]
MSGHLTLMKKRANQLLTSHRLTYPITCNVDYVEAVTKKYSDEERKAAYTKVIREMIGDPKSNNVYSNGSPSLSSVVEWLVKCAKPPVKKDAAAEALNSLDAYYKIALKRFIDGIVIEVIDEKLLAVLADILSPVTVFKMPDEMVESIAGESTHSRALRGKLAGQIDVLEKGSETCKRFAGSQ